MIYTLPPLHVYIPNKVSSQATTNPGAPIATILTKSIFIKQTPIFTKNSPLNTPLLSVNPHERINIPIRTHHRDADKPHFTCINK